MLNDFRKKHASLGMAYIDYKKAYDRLDPIPGLCKVFNFQMWLMMLLSLLHDQWRIGMWIWCHMENSRLRSTSCRRWILQWYSISPLLFVLCMIPLTKLLRKVSTGYTLKCGQKLNHLLFFDDLKIYGMDEREVNRLISTAKK